MIDQPALPGFDDAVPRRMPTVEEAAAARDAGMAEAADHAGAAWADAAYAMLRGYLELHEFFHVDEFWSWAYARGFDDGPSPRAFGPVVRRAAKAGVIRKTNTHLPSARSRLAPKPVWRSMLYTGRYAHELRGVAVA